MFKLKVNIKAVPYSSLVLNTNLGVSPRPGSQTSAARYRAAAHSLSSTALVRLAFEWRSRNSESTFKIT